MNRREMMQSTLLASVALASTNAFAQSAGATASASASVTGFRQETDSMGIVNVPADKLWGAQTQRSLEHFSIGPDLMPREMVTTYAILKKAAANVNYSEKRLTDQQHDLIVKVCDEIIDGQHADMFPLHVWMTGSGTQFNMNVNEVISNRCCQIAGTPLGSHTPVHPNDHVNMSQSSNDSFPTAMYMAAAINVKRRLMPAIANLRDSIGAKAKEWMDIVKIGRTHMQDATPITLGQEWSGYEGMLTDNLERLDDALKGTYRLALGGTAVGTGLNTTPQFAPAVAAEIARLTNLPFVTAPNKFTVQGAHDALIHMSGTMRTLAVSLYKIANDIRLMSCGPRAGFAELIIPENEPGSSIMPGKVNPTQAEALAMVAAHVMGSDVSTGIGGASGYLEMNVYKPLIIFDITHSITIMTDSSTNFRKFLVEGTKPNLKKIKEYVDRSLMLVTALSPVIGYDKASKIAHYAYDNDLTLKEAALKLNYVSEADFDRIVDPRKMVTPYVAHK
ncbi:class II fumarate hydratase [Paraburkholderia sp. BR14374]|uniref:class II fumarate hydratase n=1 Tax=Paraburkholderia sp. BR14374 TaxID=3237007 RepID=UPI0034CF309E